MNMLEMAVKYTWRNGLSRVDWVHVLEYFRSK